MKNSSLRRTSGLAALVLAATVSLAACSSDDSEGTATESTPSSSAPAETPSETPTEAAEPAMDAPFGPGCADVPAEGAGSFDGMATEPVATAASANPGLKTLVAAVGAAELVDTLNSTDGITVFAPADSAFAKIDKKDLDALLADKASLTKVLTYHVVPGRLAPDQLAGTHKTLEGSDLVVKGSGEEFTVGSGDANVVCGNVQTANATVYIIDSVLMP